MINNKASATNGKRTHAESTRPAKSEIGIENLKWPNAEVDEEITSQVGALDHLQVGLVAAGRQTSKGLPHPPRSQRPWSLEVMKRSNGARKGNEVSGSSESEPESLQPPKPTAPSLAV